MLLSILQNTEDRIHFVAKVYLKVRACLLCRTHNGTR